LAWIKGPRKEGVFREQIHHGLVASFDKKIEAKIKVKGGAPIAWALPEV